MKFRNYLAIQSNFRWRCLSIEMALWFYFIFLGTICYMVPDFCLAWIFLIGMLSAEVRVRVLNKVSKAKFNGEFNELASSLYEMGFYMTSCKEEFCCFRTMLVFNHFKIKATKDEDTWILEAKAGVLKHLYRELGDLKIKLI
ncbi:MAG: hypothetical protein HRU35_04570 [Rickettsiaceae bacterium]|nr:hypothetical protein [Rickettsiaceae bacterium]